MIEQLEDKSECGEVLFERSIIVALEDDCVDFALGR